jgi:hypothetical protein
MRVTYQLKGMFLQLQEIMRRFHKLGIRGYSLVLGIRLFSMRLERSEVAGGGGSWELYW